MKFNRLVLAAAMSVSLALSGCTTAASLASTVATDLSSSTPAQVTTLSEALQAATLVTKAVDLYVNSANPDRATLIELKALSDGVHAALTTLEADNAAGHSLVFGSYNAALNAFQAYATAKGVKN